MTESDAERKERQYAMIEATHLVINDEVDPERMREWLEQARLEIGYIHRQGT